MDLPHAKKMLAALAHEGRLSLFKKLVQSGPQGLFAGDLSRFSKINPTTASAQLLVLENAGLVRSNRDGRHVIYTAAYDNMQGLLRFLMVDCCDNRPEICSGLITVCETKA